MTRLSVNVNKVATLRNTRTHGIPSVPRAARLCLDPGAEYNIEGNPFHGYLEFAEGVRPTQCTLVPDAPEAFTSNQGWDLNSQGGRLRPVVETLHGLGCRVSLFMDPEPEQIDLVPGL